MSIPSKLVLQGVAARLPHIGRIGGLKQTAGDRRVFNTADMCVAAPLTSEALYEKRSYLL
jgi:hypothetical protein